ncbi:hypothetical protein [Phocaeicola sp.]
MRRGYDKLSGIVCSFGNDPEDGTAYVFTSKDQKLVKIIRNEYLECQFFIQYFDNKYEFCTIAF